MAHAPSYEELLRLFRSVDTNNSGCITIDELQRVLGNGSWKPFNRKVLKMLMDLFDTNNSGSITFEEFGSLWKYILGWYNCFQFFDHDHSGSLDRRELKTALDRLGYYVSNCDVAEYLYVYDRSGSGNLSFDDFVEVCIEVARKSFSTNIHNKIGCKMFY